MYSIIGDLDKNCVLLKTIYSIFGYLNESIDMDIYPSQPKKERAMLG